MKPNGESVPKTRRSKKKLQPPHPWEENPGDYFTLFGSLLRPLPGNQEAAKIIEEHNLNSVDSVFARCEYLKEIQKFADLWTTETNPALKEIIECEVSEFIDRKNEFAFFGREFFCINTEINVIKRRIK